jgi:hypothetical protein
VPESGLVAVTVQLPVRAAASRTILTVALCVPVTVAVPNVTPVEEPAKVMPSWKQLPVMVYVAVVPCVPVDGVNELITGSWFTSKLLLTTVPPSGLVTRKVWGLATPSVTVPTMEVEVILDTTKGMLEGTSETTLAPAWKPVPVTVVVPLQFSGRLDLPLKSILAMVGGVTGGVEDVTEKRLVPVPLPVSGLVAITFRVPVVASAAATTFIVACVELERTKSEMVSPAAPKLIEPATKPDWRFVPTKVAVLEVPCWMVVTPPVKVKEVTVGLVTHLLIVALLPTAQALFASTARMELSVLDVPLVCFDQFVPPSLVA